MEMRTLGRTGIEVSKICLGTMTWGEQNTEEEGHAQIKTALEYGVNFLDTAEMYSVPPREETYGATERIIGSWLKKTGRRGDVVIASKVAGPGIKYIRPHINKGKGSELDRQSVLEACDASLKRLNTDYIDLYQIHWPSRASNYFGKLRYEYKPEQQGVPLEETLSAMKELVDAGKIRAVGLSNETTWGTMHCLALAEKLGVPRVATVQNPYSLLNRSYEVSLAELFDKEDVGLLAYSPLAAGYLTGKYCGGVVPKGSRIDIMGERFGRYRNKYGEAAMEKYVALARKHELDPAQMANAFVNMQPFLTSNIIGATSQEQLVTALETHDMILSEEVLKGIEEIEREFPIPCP